MRKEGVIILGGGIILLVLSSNYYHIFNALALFLLAGGIPGTKLFLPDSFMPILMFAVLLLGLAWLLSNTFGYKLPLTKKFTHQSEPK